jgi:hypothetical protein
VSCGADVKRLVVGAAREGGGVAGFDAADDGDAAGLGVSDHAGALRWLVGDFVVEP